MENIDKNQLQNLIVGTIGILSIYGLSGIIHEKLYVAVY